MSGTDRCSETPHLFPVVELRQVVQLAPSVHQTVRAIVAGDISTIHLGAPVSAYVGYTSYYGLGNAVDLDECIAGGQGGGVPAGEVLGVDCDHRGI